LRFASLGSGSRGNATLISHQDTNLLIDCGFSVRETERRLAVFGMSPTQLAAILVTHEHQDHVQGVGALARKYQLPVYLSNGTHQAIRWGELPECRLIEPECEFTIGAVWCDPFTVPHDAAEPLQFVFDDGDHRLGLLTDTGRITAHIVEKLQQLDVLLLECNHDVTMLANSGYPPSLKQRVGGEYGHLNNDQATALLGRIDSTMLQHVVAWQKHWVVRPRILPWRINTPGWIGARYNNEVS
jgi:phosphoribosyl 1,2-cyclic phosphodiesterase